MSDKDEEAEVTERVERFDTGCSLTVELKRGTGTRDQDKITAKLKRETLDEVEAERDDPRRHRIAWMNERLQEVRE